MTQTESTSAVDRSSSGLEGVRSADPSSSAVFRVGLVALVLTTLIWRYWTLRSWSWFQDDWIYLTKTTELPFWDYVTQNYNGHLMPGQFALAWSITKIAPLDYSLAVAATLFFLLASLLAWAAALRTIFGERTRLLYPLLVLALSPLFMPISLWWAAAMQVFPLQLSMGLSVLFVARYALEGQRRRDLAGLGLSFVFGLVFWQKALLVLVPIALVAMLLARGSVSARVRAAARIAWLPLLIAAAYVPAYVRATREGDAAGTELFEQRSFGQTVDFFLTAILDVGVPALVGGPWDALSNPQQVFTTGSGVLTLFFLTVALLGGLTALRLRRHAGLALSMAGLYAFASWGLLFTSSRFEVMGIYSVRDARYAADILPVALLTVAFVIAPTRAEDRATWLRHSVPGEIRKIGQVAFVVLVAAISASAVWANGRIWDASSTTSPKVWVDNVVADARVAGTASVYDAMAPGHVILSAYFWGDGALSQLLKPLTLPLRFNEPADTMLTPDWAGRLTEVNIETVSRNASPGPVEGCGYLVRGGEQTVIPLDNQLYDWQWGYQIDYFGGQPAIVAARTDTEVVELQLQRGLNHVQFVVEDSASQLVLEGHPDASPVCVTEVRAGPVQASDRRVTEQAQP